MILNKYFEYTSSERRGVSLLILLCSLVWLFPYLLPILFPKSSTDFSSFDVEIAAFEESQNIPTEEQGIAADLFDFNPNTISKAELLQLGISEKVAQTLLNYRSKVGRFKNKSDLKKIYGLSEDTYQSLKPYIQLKEDQKKITSNVQQKGKTSSPVLFVFDPNTASSEDLKRLGLASKTVQTILNFRAKNGRFYKKEDLQKIYTLPQREYEKLKDYIKIAPLETSPTIAQSEEIFTEKNGVPTAYDAVVSPKVILDINKATQEEWQQLRGIGPTYAARIVKFREALGGFSSVDQVASTYNLPDSTFQSIQLSLRPSPIFRTLLINEVDATSLKSHPYLNWKMANILVNYRDQHGNFNNLEDLRKVKGLSEETLDKIAPYLKF